MSELPLYKLFDDVRNRYNRHLGLSDYMLLLDALQQGIGVADTNELQELCALLWLKTKPHQDDFKAFFKHFVAEQTVSLKVTENREAPIDGNEKDEKNPLNPQNNKNKTDENALKDKSDTPSVSEPKTDNTASNNQETTASDSGKDMVKVQWNIDKITSDTEKSLDELAMEGSKSTRWQLSGKYIMTENYLPFSERQLTQEWRRLRRKQVVGDSRDIDIQATIKHVAQQGFFDKPILQRRFVNDYRLIVLVDLKGSMLAFHTLSDRLVETLKQTLPKTEVWYFRNQPQQYFYGRPDWTQAITTEDWLLQFKQKPANLLIISDGGAARGNFVTERLQAWWRFFKILKPIAPTIVWLNPMPKERWVETTAGYVEKLVNMREISENDRVIKDVVKIFKN